MPTITTTVTSAQATGAVTTVTTTEATPEVAAAAAEAAFALPKITSGHAIVFVRFQFANKEDASHFTTHNFSGTQGSSFAAGAVTHVFETSTPNEIYVLVSMETASGAWQHQQDFWTSHPLIGGAVAKATHWHGHAFGEYDASFKAAIDSWGDLPNGDFIWSNDTLSAYKLAAIKPHSVVLIGLHEHVPSFNDSVADMVSFSKCHASSFAFGDIGNGMTMLYQVFDTGADLGRMGDNFTPYMQSGANPKMVEWVTTTPFKNYAVGGLDAAALKALAPYGELANFEQNYPKLIGGSGGDGKGGSHVMHYFRNAADATAGKAAYQKIFQAARDNGANIGGTVTNFRGCESAISVIINWDTVGDWAAAHEVAYTDDTFQAVAANWIHSSVEIYGSMTHELASTFAGWESLGSNVFRDTPAVYTAIAPVLKGDDPVECMQWIDVDGDFDKYMEFYHEPAVAKLTHDHRATFVVTKYGPAKAKIYFRFPNSQAWADFWTQAAGDKLTAIVDISKSIECRFWGNYNPAARAVIAMYESMPQFTMHEDHADIV